ncbi:E3 ubiquitin-protein ligase rnf213-alpha-like [Saccostrea echinata]|uniref:E3 ubiquitin-protein ligase rnf213-alpha-like n=1 Tax=Saccostrea echinata TaxID=191078 RepID=UPI002A8383E1|nr:E3 ubiquitin-protein ligase rnf213-alpha-like [Saccostrea echinata]
MTTRSKSDVVEIHFQAIASKKFIDNSAVNSVRIRFALEEYGGLTNLWPTYSVLLPDGHVAVSFRGYFSKERIKTPGFRYCYCVVINNDLSNVVDEYVYNAWKVDENNLRQLQKDNIPDLWMQYDGILNPLPEKAFLQKLKSMVGYDSYEKKMEKDAIFSAKYFFPKWKHFFVHGWDTTGADMLRQMEMLYAGLHKNVFISCKKWTLEEDFKTFLGKVWIEDLKPKLDELEKKPDLISAIGIIVIAEEYLLPLDAKNKNALFQSLVLEADFEEMKCPMYDKFKESFQGVIPRVKKGLLEFIKSVKSSDDPTWLCSLPLYHFLIGKCRPFEAMTKRVDHNAVKPLWWGKDGLEIEMDYLKGKTKWSVDPEIILQTLAPMFEIDFYLSRSFVSVLKLEKLTVVKTKLLPPEVVMAALYFFLRTDYFENDTKKKIAYDCLEVAAEQMRKSCELENISQDQLTRAYLCIKIGADVLSMANSHHRDRTSIVLWATEAFVVALAVYEQLIERTSKEGNSMESERLHLVTLNEKKGLINDWLNRFIFYPSVEADLEVWSKILSMNIPNSSIKDALMSELKDTLQEKLDKKTKLVKEHLITLYFNDADQLYPPAVQEILGQFVNQALDEGCICEENVRYGRGALKLGSMLSRKFEESWGKNHLCKAQPRDILNFTLTWKPFKHFLDMVYQKEKSGVLSQECQVQFTQATSVLQLTLNKLLTGEIEIGDVLLIDNWKDAFYCLNNIIWKSEKNTDLEEELVLQTIKLRCREIQKVKEVQANVGIFVQQCQHFKVDLCEIDKKMESLTNIERMKVLEVCKPATLDKVSNIDNYDPVVNIFNLPPDVLDILPHLKRMSEGVLFFNMWIKQGQREEAKKKSPLTIEEVVENVWQNVKHTWLGLGRKIASGDITFREFQQYFGNIPADNLEEQLSYLPIGKTNDKDWIKERIRQFQQHRILEQCVYGANVILKVVKEYELKGDFEPVKMIDKMVQGAETKMSEFDTSLIDACNVLRGMREEHAKCLEEFINCKQLINWLRKSMESLKELKVFVDLASISAGEGDLEVAKVKCLHAATTGYAPLIFNLGDQCDYLKLLEKCQLVWKELKADPHLPTKLRDTSRHLEWLKEVKSAQGSVEVTSMKQAEAINSVGIYMVGKVDPDIHKEKPTIDDVLQLHVQKDEQGSRLPRRYQYKELQELQSKLMLVAGKAEQGRDDVERFTIVYDAIVRLCNVYIKLVSSGCVLFTNWQARFLCDPERKVCAFVKFGSGEGCIQLKGRRSEDDDVSTVIPKLAKFMENCLDEWLKYIEQKRDEYHHLNFCTIDQMVILQKEIVLMGGEVEPSNFIYPLLSNVKHDCTKMDLIGALKKAKGDVFQKEAEQKAELEENVEEEELDSDNENQAKATAIAKFISAIMDSGFSEKLAREALSKGMIEPEEIDEGLVWCVDHEDETEMEVEVSEEQVEVIVEDYEGWTKSEMSISIMTQNILSDLQKNTTAADTLIPDLEQLWEEFLSSISSSVSDYLSVEHLGIILRRLAETETFTVNRPFLSCFKRGEPNLLLCQQDEILNTVLTIYSYDPDQPLPQSDEILMCTPHTTLDEVEIFWRRAVLDTTNRIHCLVNGDLLDYEVSDKGERRLDHHMQKAVELDIPYKLVVVCSTEREYHSRIVAALDKYRRPPLPLMTHNNMTKYIKDKLTFDIRRPSATPAAEADFEHCTVRVVKSWRAGVGKSLHKKRLAEKLHGLHGGVIRSKKAVVSIPLHEREINIDDIMGVLLDNTLHPGKIEPRLFHIDLSHEVQEGVDYLLFQLLILGCLTNSTGHVWRKLPYDLYIVETMPLLARDYQEQRGYIKCMHRCLDILPDVTCRSPQESLKKYQGNAPNIGQNDLLFDGKEFESNVFQRPFQYLYRLDMNRGLGDVDMRRTEGNPQTCLQTLLKHCGIRDPSWAELRHFVWFLNTQLVDFENSAFLGLAAAKDLPGFSQFVLRFLIQMSRDFATRSLNMSEESPIQMLQRMDTEEEEDEEDVLHQFQLRRTWESSPHPYLFFNPDHNSMTFLGFNIERQTGNLIDVQTGTVLERGIMQRNLQNALTRNRVPINENFDNLPRIQKLIKLCSVMGVEDVFDPDPTYELTTDNVKKILAIYMRFRCDIPVIIMGETGCGKTRLVKFMCQLQCPIGVEVQNMILMKVHGGTRRSDIIRKVLDAERIAQENTANYGQRLYTVLFFDEANTTEAIGLIKEIMCDRSMEGEPLKLCQTLKIVAACNPYRKHSEDLIKRLEQAGLGYHVDADKTTDRMGRVPMRRLVYRVQPLPQSMLPLVWDFGQLDTNVEEMYIKQMVLRYIRGGKLPDEPNLDTTVSHILTSAQEFMRRQQDECSFVSLRDVERVLEVISWFYRQSQGETDLFDLMEEEEEADSEEEEEEEMEDQELAEPQPQTVSDLTKSLVLALGVCYHACLKNREEFRKEMVNVFRHPCVLPKFGNQRGAKQMFDIITRCQNIFLEIDNLGANIAKNQALRENVFMMVVCIELRIPLFLVGKPGSSKSLAKTIVADAMQGNAAHTEIYRNYKQVQMVSFQCSPLSVPEGIVGTFRQCAMYQKDKDLNRFVSVVVLDEVGLAEDSPRMPLKTLHPLLEDGCQGDEKPEEHKKVAFIGISNWALDPAKMNRGILVQREVPDLEELEDSADGICSGDRRIKKMIKPLIKPLAESYLQVFQSVIAKREFFGLRDFYSLIKMVYSFAEKNNKKPTWLMLQHCIKRNFGGFEHSADQDPLAVFSEKLKTVEKILTPSPGDPDCTPAGLIEACLQGDGVDSDTRYLLLLTENYGALTVLQQKIQTMKNAITIFGSSFPSDQEYTQVCRNINRIKICMETGKTVVLLNLENLYESLYDALNQYYVYFGGERYVDLGLGTHRVKCRVHKNFRLIVVAEKEVVYSKFPIPLINRLEKHFLNISTMLSPVQVRLAQKLQNWAEDFVKTTVLYLRNPREKKSEYKTGDVFMGFHADTCASIILHISQKYSDDDLETIEQEVMQAAKELLLWCATPDGVLRAKQKLPPRDFAFVENIYYAQQKHDNLLFYLNQKIRMEVTDELYAQVTTNSKLITTVDVAELSQYLHIPHTQITLLTLQSFDTEQQFCRQVKQSFERDLDAESLLIVQCDSGNENASLVACAQYSVLDQLQQLEDEKTGKTHIVFIIHLPRVAGGGFTGFQCGLWHSVHIDDLRPDNVKMPSFLELRNKSIGTLMETAAGSSKSRDPEEMDWEGRPDHNKRETEDIGMEDQDVYQHDFGSMMEYTGQAHVEKEVDIPFFIKLTAHPALAMVKDPAEDSARTTERVKILLELLHQETREKMTFMKGVGHHLAALMKEKEETMGQSAGSWLYSEATNRDCINRVGTFRKARDQCIIEKLSPILAGIIAQVDTNSNLDLLIKTDSDTWENKLWLEIINDPSATQIEYSMIVSPKRQQELPEVMVRGTGCDGQKFTAQMPFSWLIYKLIDQILRTSQNLEKIETIQELVIRVTGIIENTSLGKVLQKCLGEVKVPEFVKPYLSDFVHMVYHVTSVEEHGLVCENLLNGMNMDFREGLQSVVMNFVAIHAVYNKSVPRLRNFAGITRVWPECSAKIIEFQQKSAQFYLVTDEELALDILGLYLLLQSLEPGKDSLNDHRGRQYWQKQVLKYRPVVERILGQFVQEVDPSGVEEFGRRCREGMKEARCMWTRITVMKLFLQHVCSEDTQPAERCMMLWMMLKDNVDFKKLESLEKVEKFLKICMKKVVKTAIGCQTNCTACESEITEKPIQLPCKDVICIKCYNEMKILRATECPACHSEISGDFDPQEDNTQRIKFKKLQEFQRRCNSFFMDLVSQLCFSDDVPPSRHVVEKLMSHITATAKSGKMASKELSVFEEGIDPTPVLRSFLLQHLLRTNSDEVRECLGMYLDQVEKLMSLTENEEKMIELSLLVIQCLEDSFDQEVTKNSDPEKSKIKMATHMLQHNVHLVMKEGLDIEKLYCMAETRFGLIVVAEILHKLLVEKSIKGGQSIRRLLEAAGRLCDECRSKQPKLFLIKHLCRCFGLETYQKVCKTSDAATVRWLSVPELQKNEIVECSDRFIVCGDQYKALREKLTQAALGQNMDIFNTAIESVRAPEFQKRTLTLLAILREITMSYLYPENKRRVTAAAIELLHQFMAQHPLFANQAKLHEALCRNALWRRNPQLTVQEGMDLGHQSTVCLLNHFFITLLQIPEESTLIEPLNKLVQQPQDMQGAFLPTMPQDNVAEMREALLAARGVNDANPVFYRCPNGHPYVIGNCGRPAIVGRCKDCGQEIGGQGHQLIAGNILDQGLDQTATGHILGRAEGRQPVASPERSLSPIECAIVRLFTHMAMYLGASINLEAIESMIKPDLDQDIVLPFLWAHIEKDLVTIQRAIGKSVDDVYILIHRICNDIMEKHRGTQMNQEICFLANKNSRMKWEEDFTQTYLSPVLKDMDSFLKSLNKQLANDQRLGSDPLLCLLFEMDIPSEHSSPSTLHNVQAVWRYRSQITMDHLLHTLQVQSRAHQVLIMFLQEEHHLRAIRLVPNILKLQRVLIQRYQRKLDRVEATRMSIEDMIESYENEGRAEEIKNLVRDFIEAWQCVREQLLTFSFPTLEGLARVPKEYCHKSITETNPVSVLLPTFRDAGLCSYGLLYFLLKKQNNFLQEYCKKKKTVYTQLPKVQVNDVTSAHLISFHPDRDILPMVMANCHYTFEVGKGTKIDYNFGDLERQLMDRFLFSKSVIDMPVYEYEMMTYRSETTNAVVFRHLRQKIKQEPLTPAVANQISEEIRAYPDLCQTLDKLDITISFLKSVGGDANMSLEKFMTQTLKMENPFPSQKARSSCMCKHAQSLWITLAMEKTKRQASHKEDAFEGVASELRVDLQPDQRDIIKSFCEELSIERLELLLETLFECIMLTITVPKGTDDDDLDMSKLSLRETLIGYVSAPQYDLDPNNPGWMMNFVEQIPNEGENFTKIMNNQAVDVWLFLYAIYTQKQSERR